MGICLRGDISVAIKHYRALFSLPSFKTMLIMLLALSSLIGLITGILLNELLKSLLTAYLAILQGALTSTAISKVILKEPHLTWKRLLGISLVATIFLCVGFLIGALLTAILGDLKYYVLATTISCTLLIAYAYIIFNAMAKSFKAFIASLTQPISSALGCFIALSVAWQYPIDIEVHFIPYTAMLIMAVILARAYSHTIDKLGKAIVGYGTLELFRAFLNTWYLDNAKLLEDLLEKLSNDKETSIHLVKIINQKQQKAAIVIPKIHAGPYRKVGSSAFPSSMITRFLENQSYCLFLHPPISHEMDLPTSKEAESLVDEVVERFKQLNTTPAKASKAIRLKNGKTTVTAQKLNNTSLVLITRSPHPSEDLPAELEKIVFSRLEPLKTGDVVLVDAHNCIEGVSEEIPQQNLEEISNAVLEAVKTLTDMEQSSLEVGFSWRSLDPYLEEHGIGKGGLTAAVFKTREELFALIAYDANNMFKGVREELLREIEQKVDIAEVTTTDVHTTSVLKPGEGYYPLGKVIPLDYIKQKTIEALEEAKQNISPAELAHEEVKVKVKVLGENIWKLANLVDKSVRKAKNMLPLLIFSLLALAIATSLFIA
ncbi:MAG: hypothetical protein DRJ33_02995 [Candidatus Methanomethylicota archaeon]|uniref:DUF2070 domain-containing protein n=1 Tax=Thermoproteota archaeon TaxID=2056631 RepID=A0A497EZU3_9CREN|nr:MAG: hypothetical protein DRJ33_02995 [Candidatus Verstraetearchaeota archaeon]